MRRFLKERLYDPVVTLLVQGVTPDKIALALALGAVCGIFPVLGVSTPLCALAVVIWRVNLVLVQAVNFLVYPFQILLIIPFVRVGESILDSEPQPLSIHEGLTIIGEGVTHAVTVLWDAIIHSIIGWAVIGPVAIVALFSFLRPLLRRLSSQVNQA